MFEHSAMLIFVSIVHVFSFFRVYPSPIQIDTWIPILNGKFVFGPLLHPHHNSRIFFFLYTFCCYHDKRDIPFKSLTDFDTNNTNIRFQLLNLCIFFLSRLD